MKEITVESANVVYADLFPEEKIRILHVDNDAAFLATAAHCLEEQGPFQVDTALSAKEALKKLRNADYAAVVADYKMPEKNGLELLKELRQEGIDVPFILFTCKSKEEIAIEALNSGVEQYIDKQGDVEAIYEELKHSILSAVKRQRTEKLLKKYESHLRQITENIQDLLLLTNVDAKITYASSSIKWILGYAPSEIMGKPIYEFVHPDDLAKITEIAKQALVGHSAVKLEARCKRADGSYALMEGVEKTLTDEKGQVTGAVITSRDITERKKAEAKLVESERRYRSLFANMNRGFALCKIVSDNDGKPTDYIFLEVNDDFEKLTGLGKEAVLGKRISEVFFSVEKDPADWIGIYGRVVTTGEPARFESYFERLKKWFSVAVYRPEIGYFAMAFDDITDRKKAEEALKRYSAYLENIFAASPNAITVSDSNGNVVDCNQGTLDMLGFSSKEELIGRNGFSLIAKKDQQKAAKHQKEAMEQGSVKNAEYTFLTKDGLEVLAEVSASAIRDSSGNPTGFVSVTRDIAERKRTEQTLKESEEKYRKLFEEAIDAIFIADVETGILVDCNRVATKLVGRAKSELIGMHQRFLHPEETRSKFSETFKQHLKKKEGQVLEAHIITKNGEIRDVAIKASLIEVNGKKMLRGSFRDITEQKKAEEKIGFQARLLNAVGQAIIATDTNGIIIYWNKAAEQLYGWPEAEVLGRNIVDVTPAESSKEQAAKILNKLIAGESWSGEFVAKRRDGTLFSAIVTDAPITDDKGEIIGIIGISTDISEQKWMQEIFNDAIGKVVELNEKLQVVGSLSRHDIRNKLAAVNGRIFLLKKRLNGNAEALLQLKEMEVAAQQMLRILEFERIYEQVGVEELKNIDVEQHLNEAVSLFSDLKGAELINECHGLTVLADSLLRQVFYNLIDNSLKYGEKISKIRVHYEEEENQLKLIYEDNGVGIPGEVRSNLFKEGFGRGTGYGLFLMKRICEAYGWTIQETGKYGQGAQFTMTIPKSSKDGKRSYEIT